MRLFLMGYRWIGFFLIALGLMLGCPTLSLAALQLTVTWSDRSTNEDGFRVERKTGTAAYAQITQKSANVTSFIDSTVTAGITYCYRVRAFNAAGNSGYSPEACGKPSVSFTLTVTKTGTGTGTVTSTPTGISCGTTCVASYLNGTTITLAATTSSGSTSGVWIQRGKWHDGGGCLR